MRPIAEGEGLLVGPTSFNERINSLVELAVTIVVSIFVVGGKPIKASVEGRNETVKADRNIVDKLHRLRFSCGSRPRQCPADRGVTCDLWALVRHFLAFYWGPSKRLPKYGHLGLRMICHT